jgi:hypothetical protein
MTSRLSCPALRLGDGVLESHIVLSAERIAQLLAFPEISQRLVPLAERLLGGPQIRPRFSALRI